jgi:hypothetical protein
LKANRPFSFSESSASSAPRRWLSQARVGAKITCAEAPVEKPIAEEAEDTEERILV